MKRWLLLFALTGLLAMLLIGCGSRDEGDVVADLSDNLEEYESYRADVVLTLQTGGGEAHEYELETWHQKPDFYRISFTNPERDMTQIILKNDEGVFVLTPHLNKSFRFQSGWPDNQSQVYLYDSLVEDVITDPERIFSMDGDHYVFDTAANYQNRTLSKQRVHFDSDLKPSKVEVMDADSNILVEAEFTNFEFNESFEDGAFDMKSNMQGAEGEERQPETDEGSEEEETAANGNEAVEGEDVKLTEDVEGVEGGDKAAEKEALTEVEEAAEEGDVTEEEATEEGTEKEAAEEEATEEEESAAEEQRSFGTVYPEYVPGNTDLIEAEEVQQGDQAYVVLRYGGDYNFTLIQQRPQAAMVTMQENGEPVDLGYTIGVRNERSLVWTYDGIEYTLTAEEMPAEEMISVAESVVGQAQK